MKITYDKRVDALNLVVKTGRMAKTVEISPEVMLDLDKNGNPLYLEIIGVSEKIGKKNFANITIGTRSIPMPALV